ncbi:hypothetical protein KA025_02520 [Candidatus Saccharibacteria bacterium]|nr:hypothetical protein [Candidatus Saccharibacteria bacterium]
MATANIKGSYYRLWWQNGVVQSYLKDSAMRFGQFNRGAGILYVSEILIACDVSAIPAGSTINSATLTFSISSNNLNAVPQTAALRKQDLGSWTDTGSAPVYDTFDTADAWPSALSTLGSLDSSSTGSKTIPTSASLVSLIQGWVDGTGTPHDGVVLTMNPAYFDYYLTVTITSFDVDYTPPQTSKGFFLLSSY